jgi:Proteasome complex subunit Rpn13, Pru domain
VRIEWYEREKSGSGERKAGASAEAALCIMAMQATAKLMPQRVLLLSVLSPKKRFFFWMQETDAEKDAVLTAELQKLLSSPPSPPSSTHSHTAETDLHAPLASAVARSATAPTPATATAPAPAPVPVPVSAPAMDLQSILQSTLSGMGITQDMTAEGLCFGSRCLMFNARSSIALRIVSCCTV